MRGILTFLLISCAAGSYAQMEGKDRIQNLNDLVSGNAMFRSFDNRFKGIEGYPTIMKAYCPGQIIMSSGMKVNHDSINFDIYNNDLLVKRRNIETVVNKGMVAGFSIESPLAVMNFTKLRNKEGEESFYEVLVKGKVTLYKRVIKTISGPTNSGAYSSGRTYSIFEENAKLYFQKESGGELVELKNKKSVLSEFSEIEDSITEYMKENRVDVKNEGDIIRLIEFVNSI